MLGSLLSNANQTLAHSKSFRVANIACSLDEAYFSIRMGVRINDNDFATLTLHASQLNGQLDEKARAAFRQTSALS